MSSRKHPLCRIALLCALLGLISLLPCLIGSHGQLLYYGDYESGLMSGMESSYQYICQHTDYDSLLLEWK